MRTKEEIIELFEKANELSYLLSSDRAEYDKEHANKYFNAGSFYQGAKCALAWLFETKYELRMIVGIKINNEDRTITSPLPHHKDNGHCEVVSSAAEFIRQLQESEVEK